MDRDDVALTGKALRVYRLVLRQGKPIGVREVQRTLKLSSPALAFYHLTKLEEAGLLKQTSDGYVIEKVILENFVKLRRLYVPKYMFYSLFFLTATIFEIFVFGSSELTKQYLFSIVVTVSAAVSYAYETIMMLRKNRV